MVFLYLSRLSITFFAISGLDVLGRLDLLEQHKNKYIDWIYLFQITPDAEGEKVDRCGFRGSTAATRALSSPSSHPLDTSHITMTYAAINCLLILGDDLSRIDRRGILSGVKALQLGNGRYSFLKLKFQTLRLPAVFNKL